ncbi:hypothetical protein [Citrobacter portucalensis]|uniref:hypothetical protein n=1 Tax=Citrobacter portucalensis TaxID=1639133 RepID=UPI001F270D43|nr:hypothetical protein [Citrobacter portucalensis]MCX8985652.1 hypothetical protein [Citrobacter portucalensis]
MLLTHINNVGERDQHLLARLTFHHLNHPGLAAGDNEVFIVSEAFFPHGDVTDLMQGIVIPQPDLAAGRGVTVNISDRCIVLMADCNKVQNLREQLFRLNRWFRGLRACLFSGLNDNR